MNYNLQIDSMQKQHPLESVDEFAPSRNLIVFAGDAFPANICNEYVNLVYEFLITLLPELFTSKYNIEIRANRYNYILRIFQYIPNDCVQKLLLHRHNLIDLIYLETRSLTNNLLNNLLMNNDKLLLNNTIIHINNLYKCTYGILYTPCSFQQPDDIIRYHVLEIIMNIVPFDYICFIGGECTLFGKVLHYSYGLFYTNFNSIYNDINLNIKIDNEFCKSRLINYDTDSIRSDISQFMCENKFCIILNTGKTGMGRNLAEEIGATLAKRIIVISCNAKSFAKDMQYLSKKGLNVKYSFSIKTNYDITIYIIE